MFLKIEIRQDQGNRRNAPANRIGQHQYRKGMMNLKDCIGPSNTNATNTDQRNDGRHKLITIATHTTGNHF